MIRSAISVLSVFFLTLSSLYAQQPLDLKNQTWNARWIQHPTASTTDYGVFHFRKQFEMETLPEEFIIHISADNRYRLFINGEATGIGPARGDEHHWRYETYDIRDHLQAGTNTIAVQVWNFSTLAPYAQHTSQTGLIIQGNRPLEEVVNTNSSWKVMQNMAYSPETKSYAALRAFVVVGPGDIVRGEDYPWGWEQPEYDDTGWREASSRRRGNPYGNGTDAHVMLIPRDIPLMEDRMQRMHSVRRSEGINVGDAFILGNQPLRIPANTRVSFLVDNGHLTTAYPELKLSGGQGSGIRVTYSEALFDENRQKGNRDEIEGKEIIGYQDYFYPDGESDRLFRPLWFRTYRYIRLDIVTADDPLVLHDYYGHFTGYPFEEMASFKSNDASLEPIWDIGWRTARLCAGETHYDCPYYEQLSYIGDTRIQALVTVYVSGDDRLMKKSIRDFFDSGIPDGLTQSRYPSRIQQVIPPYSLFWIAMIHDYWMLRDDPEFIREMLPGVQNVLAWYERHLAEEGLLGEMPWWHFVDWANEFRSGIPNGGDESNSSILTLQYAYALDLAADLYNAFGNPERADSYVNLSEKIKNAVYNQCWDTEKKLLADTPKKEAYSQHANIFGILTNAIPGDEQEGVMDELLENEDLIQATFYFRFYLFRAMVTTGYGDRYLEALAPWHDMVDLGLTTFAEKPDPTRSDCHAWSASPVYDLLATVAGINPGSAGFRTVRITPHPGNLETINASMPHPDGMIQVDLENGKKMRGTVTLPGTLSGTFEFAGSRIVLEPGQNKINVKK